MVIDDIFFQISILLSVVAGVSFIVHLLKQPLIIAYIITGIISGPVVFNLIQPEADFYHAFAEFGVVLLLFVLGLSLNFSHLKKIGKVALTTAFGQLVFTTTIGLLILIGFGFGFVGALYLAVAITFSSTIIIIKMLSDKKETESLYGQYTIGLMLVQDIIAIVILLFIPLLSEGGSFWQSLGVWALKGVILFSIIYSLAKFILPVLLDRIAKSSEFLFIFTIAWCFGIAGLAHWGGFSLEVGALMAGLSLGSTPYHFEIGSRIRPLRDFFIMLFFIILGAQMNLSDLGMVILPGLVLSVFVLIGNPFILYILYRLNHFTRRNSFLAGITAAQVSEFGFVLLFVGAAMGHVDDRQLATYTITALVTIFISSYLITYNKKLYRVFQPVLTFWGRKRGKKDDDDEENQNLHFDVWVFGYHRMGWKICESLKQMKKTFAVVDFNPAANLKLKHRGIPSYFGDAGDIEFLTELPIERAKMVIMTIPDPSDQLTAIRHIKKIGKNIIIIGTLNHTDYLDDLYAAGADYVMMPHLLGGQWMTEILNKSSWTKRTFTSLRKSQKDEMQLRFTTGKEFS